MCLMLLVAQVMKRDTMRQFLDVHTFVDICVCVSVSVCVCVCVCVCVQLSQVRLVRQHLKRHLAIATAWFHPCTQIRNYAT